MVTANYRIVDFVNNLKNMDKLGGTDQRTRSAVHGSRSFSYGLQYIGQKLKKYFFEKYSRNRCNICNTVFKCLFNKEKRSPVLLHIVLHI